LFYGQHYIPQNLLQLDNASQLLFIPHITKNPNDLASNINEQLQHCYYWKLGMSSWALYK